MTYKGFLLSIYNIFQSYRVNQLPRFGWKNLEVNRRMPPDSLTFFFILSVQLCSKFVAGFHDKIKGDRKLNFSK